jgi:hypothetical protein
MKTSIKTLFALTAIVIAGACSQKSTPTASAEPKGAYDGPMVTYAANIAPIMERSCAPCHYPEKKGKKMPLDTYVTVKDNLAEVLERVQLPKDHLRFMPYEHKKQDLSAEEIEMLKNWARGGFIES